jgi:dienelactone hydrolase
MVHGGPVPKEREIRPRRWPTYPAYGALLAHAGLVGAMFEHGFVDDDTLGVARDDVAAALAALRADPRVDGDRVGLWFFSAGGYLMGSFLEPVPEGVAAVAGTYAAVGDEELPDIGLVDGIVAAPRSTLPLLLVRPEHDLDWILPITDELLAGCAAAGRSVDVIDVPGAHHAFETVDDTDDAREGIRRSITWWVRTLR